MLKPTNGEQLELNLRHEAGKAKAPKAKSAKRAKGAKGVKRAKSKAEANRKARHQCLQGATDHSKCRGAGAVISYKGSGAPDSDSIFHNNKLATMAGQYKRPPKDEVSYPWHGEVGDRLARRYTMQRHNRLLF